MSPPLISLTFEQQGFSRRAARKCVIGAGKDNDRLFHEEISSVVPYQPRDHGREPAWNLVSQVHHV